MSQIESYKSNYNKGDYDKASENTGAVIFTFSKSTEPQLTTTIETMPIRPIPVPTIQDTPTTEILDFLLDLQHSGRAELLARTLHIPKVSEKINSNHLRRLFENLNNCRGPNGNLMKVEAWTSSLKESLTQFKIPALSLV